MATPTNFKETTRRQTEYRRQKAAFKKLAAEREKVEFLANAEPFPREFWLVGSNNTYKWWPTLAGMPIYDDEFPRGFATPEEAFAEAQKLKAEYARRLGNMQMSK